MRHGRKINKLGRKSQHRKALMMNMAVSLIKHKRINTTVPKAKSLRKYIEPLLTKAKTNTTHSRRIVFSFLKDKEAITELFSSVAEKIAKRPGGYTRILRVGNRAGDNAEMCMMELVDYNDAMMGTSTSTATSEKKTTRRGRSKAKKEENVETKTAEPESK